jgi:hypothetical protein
MLIRGLDRSANTILDCRWKQWAKTIEDFVLERVCANFHLHFGPEYSVFRSN